MTVFTIETLNALGARPFDHADSMTNPGPSRHGSRLPASCSRSPELHNSGSRMASPRAAAGAVANRRRA
jgi:hypothetical protein